MLFLKQVGTGEVRMKMKRDSGCTVRAGVRTSFA